MVLKSFKDIVFYNISAHPIQKIALITIKAEVAEDLESD